MTPARKTYVTILVKWSQIEMELQLENVVVEMVIIYELMAKHVVVSRENIL